MARLGLDQAHGHIHEQRWLQMQLPWPRVRDLITKLAARQMCGTCDGKNTLGRAQELSFSSEGGGGRCVARGHLSPLGFAAGGDAAAWGLGAVAAPSCAVLPPQQGICSCPCFKVLFTAFIINYRR